MKAFQNFLLRTKAYVYKEQSRQVEFFQKHVQNQSNHGGAASATQNSSYTRALLMNQRQRLIGRPLIRYLSSTYTQQTLRIAFMYKQMYNSNYDMNNFARQIEESEMNTSATNSVLVEPEQNYVGLLEIFNSSSKGKSKYFCGKYIDLTFQHTVETEFPNFRTVDDNMSVLESEYLSEPEEDEASHIYNINRERILNAVHNNLNFSLAESELISQPQVPPANDLLLSSQYLYHSSGDATASNAQY